MKRIIWISRRIGWQFCWISIFTLVASTAVWAKTMYITDVMKITMRTGPGISRKVIAQPLSGQPVEMIEPGRDWSQIRLPNGKEGWVLSRFLTPKKPDKLQLKNLETEHKTIKERVESLDLENEQLRSENEILKNDVTEKQAVLESLDLSYKTLQKESKDYLAVKSAYETAATELEEQKKKADDLESILSTLEWKRNVVWFLSGGGVFLLGFLIGSVNHRNKSSRSRKYY